MRIPQKVKVFTWREISNCLPMKDQLILRNVNVNYLCPVCNLAVETVDHILVQCHFAKKYWNLISYINLNDNISNIMEWLVQ